MHTHVRRRFTVTWEPLVSALVAFLLALLMFALDAFGAPPAATKPIESSGGLLEKFLDGPMSGVEAVVFAARALNPTDGHWYANFGYYSHDPERKAYAEGTKLYRLNLKTRELATLLADKTGGVRDPQVSYNGKKVLFSYRPGGTEQYHLYEMDVDLLERSGRAKKVSESQDSPLTPALSP